MGVVRSANYMGYSGGRGMVVDKSIQSLNRERVCVRWDFNAVSSIEERRSSREGPRPSGHIPFNHFINDSVLIDLPLSGRKFTWYKGDGLSMSRLDRFLLSEEWCLTWPNCIQVAQLRGLSDDCPLMLEANEENWGPLLSQMLKCWKDIPGYNQLVREKWNKIDGRGGFVLIFRLSALDGKGEEKDLSKVELEELHEITSDIDSLARRNASICWQQSRSLWLKEGDASHKKGHVISSIQVDDVPTKGVQPIRQALYADFASDFKAGTMDKPRVDNLPWKVDFWPEMQADIMHFIAKFHRNGKLLKGLNSTFITFIPKVDRPQHLNAFRLISPVGSLYQILAKVLANRLQGVIGSVITESQTVFVKDMPILDGICIENEVVDKASSVLVNGSQTKEFPLERGLRQLDPLSPFLFLLDAESLNVLMKAVVENHFFCGLLLCCLRLCQVEESLPFFRWSSSSLKSILNSLSVYSLSFFKATSSTISSIDSLLKKKIVVGVRMLGKPLGLVGILGIVVRVLAARYGEYRGCLRAGVRNGSSWWREIVRIRDVVDDLRGGWFEESVLNKLGDGWGIGGGGVDVAETVVGLGGGDVGGVLGFTSRCLIASSAPRHLAVAA
ncbi:hypothetical protein TSUD_294670 [Trifolium subterraneum]|uniref:Reverse transcriptase domain-containing protein n=1 Tax=Trifolium subterraneum TaxID=3900 RepID=A0A2Z6M7M5_TRISU|nr:hypothetical protein TSUD_294670 [Trifolium subterraneum]